MKKYYIGDFEGKKTTPLAEMKSKAAKEHVDHLRKEKNLDYGRHLLGIFVLTLLALMITYMCWNMYNDMT